MTAAAADDWWLPGGTSSDRGRLPRLLSLVEDQAEEDEISSPCLDARVLLRDLYQVVELGPGRA